MTKKMQATWMVPQLMGRNCIHSVRDLSHALAERGIHLSNMQVYRLTVQQPSRVTMDILAALCDIFSCSPNDIINVEAVNQQVRKKAVGETHIASVTPIRTKIRRPH